MAYDLTQAATWPKIVVLRRTAGGDTPVDLEKELRTGSLIPLMTVARAENAAPAVEALLEGGIACVEIAFRSKAAAEAIAAVRSRFPSFLVGAGTVLTVDQAQAAVDSGASFVVAPAFNPAVVEFVRSRGLPMLPGVATPTEMERVMTEGLTLVKLFPSGPLGGPRYVRSLVGPYPTMRYVPTGGVSEADLPGYLSIPEVAAVAGSWLVSPAALESGAWRTIGMTARRAVGIVHKSRSKEMLS